MRARERNPVARPPREALWLVLAGIAVVMSTRCVASVEERPARVYLTAPPPPPLDEAPPEAAGRAPGGPAMVWVAGYWHWNGVQYVWIPGHWERPPEGYVWVPSRYVLIDGIHVYQPGGWRPRGRFPARPAPP